MHIQVTEENIPFFEALASPARIRIIQHLSIKEANIKELAEVVGVSSAIMTSHVKKLEEVRIIKSQRNGNQGKICSLFNTNFDLSFPQLSLDCQYNYEVSIPVGHYTSAEVEATCGIADQYQVIQAYDDPRSFFDPRRFDAQLIWFTKGYVEYTMANYVTPPSKITNLEITAELSSEYPHYREDWQSDIDLYLNGEHVCMWTSPGDFGKRRGKLTPIWWTSNQYGLLKCFRISNEGVFIDEELVSEKTLRDFHVENDQLRIKFAVSERDRDAGGIAIYGKSFGNHAQDINVRVGYNM
uniref:Putative transcriptional regulator n=1 Tax=termite gut metagenome TaxID=433724 RepID=S0DDZ3_9ZZZZ